MRNIVGVLSGGGAKTAAHLGAWRAFDEAGVRPTHLIGVSMGAVMGAALASGTPTDELLARLLQVGRAGLVLDPEAPPAGLGARSLFRGDELRRVIEVIVPVRSFNDLAVPLTVPVVDLDTGEIIRYGANGCDVPLIDALCATCALPVYFPPVILGGRRLGDGGLHEVLPLEPAADLAADLVLAVDVGPGMDQRDADDETMGAPPLLRAHDDAMSALMTSVTMARLAWWRADPQRAKLVHVRPPVERYATFRLDRIEHYELAGYEAARDALDSAS